LIANQGQGWRKTGAMSAFGCFCVEKFTNKKKTLLETNVLGTANLWGRMAMDRAAATGREPGGAPPVTAGSDRRIS
jgi:hypothetical protein